MTTQDTLHRLLLNRLSPTGRDGRLSILIYHRVHQEPDPLFPEAVDAQRFDTQMKWLKALFSVLPLPEAVERFKTGALPKRAAAVTFDDGYADNAEVALPILQRHGVPATFFVSSGFLDGGRMFNDTVIEALRRARGAVLDLTASGLGQHDIATPAARRTAIETLIGRLKYLPAVTRAAKVTEVEAAVDERLPGNLMMSSAQVRQLHEAGMTIGGHTVSHPILTRLGPAAARREIEAGRAALEAITGGHVTLFAYPNGKVGDDYDSDHVAMVRELGFAAAVTTTWGAARKNSDLFQLPRFTPWDRTKFGFMLRLEQNLLR